MNGSVKPTLSRDDRFLAYAIISIGALLAIAILFPICAFLIRSVSDSEGGFVGLRNFVSYFENPSLVHSIKNSLFVAGASTVITTCLAFIFSYALTRSCMPLKPLFRAIALIPLLTPSLLPAISFVYLFGNHGVIKGLLFGHSIYGPIGIILGEVFYTFPHALIIQMTALSLADGRLMEASSALGANNLRRFFTVTLPGAKYGLISSGFVVFTLAITDFGVPKVIGGSFNVLATDVYKQVVGWQNFEMGAVVGILLLCPAAIAFIVDRVIQKRQIALLSARAVPYQPRPNAVFDYSMAAACGAISVAIVVILGMAAYASVVKFWQYNLTLTLSNYDFASTTDIGWRAYWNSFKMAIFAASFGTVVIFIGAYAVEKSRWFQFGRSAIQFIAMLPMAVPGMVLGLAYIFFFNHPANPLGFMYGTMSILVVNTIAHFYTVSHLTAVTALKQIDREFEAVSESLKVPVFRTFMQVTVPVCLPAILSISIYLFVNAMTTVSGVVFLYSPDTLLASVSVLYLDDNGALAAAAAMAMMIVYTSAAVRILHWLWTIKIEKRTQKWRER